MSKFEIKVGGKTVCETDSVIRAEATYNALHKASLTPLHHLAEQTVSFVKDGVEVKTNEKEVAEKCGGMSKDGKKWDAIRKNMKKKNEGADDNIDGLPDDDDKEQYKKVAGLKGNRLKMKAGNDDTATFKKPKGASESNGSKSWGMALASNPNAEPPCRPGVAGMWMTSIMEGKRSDGKPFVVERNAQLAKRLVEAMNGETSSKLRKKDRSRKKREMRGRGPNSTPARRKAAIQNLKKSKAKRAGARSKKKGERTRKRRARLRGD